MKKLIALLLIFVMVFSLCACASGKDSDSKKKLTTSLEDDGEENWAGKKPGAPNPTNPTEPTDPTEPTFPVAGPTNPTTEPVISPSDEPNEAILAYVEANREDMISTMEYTFATSSGLTCTSDIEVIGAGFVIYIYINELSNVDQYTKNQLQAAYDQMGEYFNTLLEMLQQELPEVEYFDVWVCDVNHDVLAIIHAGE